MPSLFSSNCRVFASSEKIRLHFAFASPGLWPSWRCLYRLCRRDSRFDVVVILCDVERMRRETGRGKISHFAGARRFLEKNRIPFVDLHDYNLKRERPHALVYQSPYECREVRRRLDVEKVKAIGIRPVYISYGIEFDETLTNNFLQDLQYQKRLHVHAWRIYVMHLDIRDRFARYCPAGAGHVRAYGHPRFDYYAMPRFFASPVREHGYSTKARGKPIVVFQLHHPNDCDCPGYGFHTWHPRKIISAIRCLQEVRELFTVVTMHPLYSERMEQFGLMEREEVHEMKNEIMSHPRSFLYEGDYQPLFMHAAAFISENSSLLIDMGYFNKPVLYLYDRPVALLPFAKRLAATFHHGRELNDIYKFIKIVLGAVDTLSNERKSLHAEIFYSHRISVAEKIKNDIEQGIRDNIGYSETV